MVIQPRKSGDLQGVPEKQQPNAEQGGQPERRIRRFLKSTSLGRRRVTLVVSLPIKRHCLEKCLDRTNVRYHDYRSMVQWAQ